MSVSPSITTANPGDTFDVDIVVVLDAGLRSRGAQVAVDFDPMVLQCNGWIEGAFYSDWGAVHDGLTMVFPEPINDNVNGHISDLGVSIMGGDPGGPNGSGIFVSYQFTALATGTSTIKLVNAITSDELGFMVEPVATKNGEVRVVRVE